MKVSELIQRLNDMPQDAKVYANAFGEWVTIVAAIHLRGGENVKAWVYIQADEPNYTAK